MKRTVVLVGSLMLAGCGLMPVPGEVAPAPDGAPRLSFSLPESWTRLEDSGTTAQYFTTGDPDVCVGVVGACDPTTYAMAPGTMDVGITPVTDESGLRGFVESVVLIQGHGQFAPEK